MNPLRTRLRPARCLLLLLLSTALAPGIAAQSATVTDGQHLTATVDARGVRQLTVDGTTFDFADLPPLVVRTTQLASGQVTYAEHSGAGLLLSQPIVRGLGARVASVTWQRCQIPGLVGQFRVRCRYEVLDPPQGPGLAVRTTLVRSNLERGIAAIAYRQHLVSSQNPTTVYGGFAGAVELTYDSIVRGEYDPTNVLLVSGGLRRIGSDPAQEFLATRTCESHFVTATVHDDRTQGLLVTRDSATDPDNTAREFGLFGSSDVAGDAGEEFGFGVVAYLPNDHLPGNGGLTDVTVGSGLMLGTCDHTVNPDPYWNIVRTYRTRWFDPVMVGVDKHAERPEWMERSLYMVINVDAGGTVAVDAADTFVDEFLAYHDQVTDLALLVWGTTDLETYQPLPGVGTLLQRLEATALRRNVTIRTAFYYLPTHYLSADPNGGTRVAEANLDPFGVPTRVALPGLGNRYDVRLGSPANGAFFDATMDRLITGYGLDGMFLDDAYRARTFDIRHYEPGAAVTGRTTSSTDGYLAQLGAAKAAFERQNAQGYLVTELAMLGRGAPGNLIQGGVDPVHSFGPFFANLADEARFHPFANDVAGEHWLCGFAGDLGQNWLKMCDFGQVHHITTAVVHGMLPVQLPSTNFGVYRDFFQICRDGLIDCGLPENAALTLQSDVADDAVAFFSKHRDVLTAWRRQPLPGTHDIGRVTIESCDIDDNLIYQLEVDELAHGCFSRDSDLAIAFANPTATTRTVQVTLRRDDPEVPLLGAYRVTSQDLADADPTTLVTSNAGPIAFVVTLPPRGFQMVRVEPVVFSIHTTPNVAACRGGSLAGTGARDGADLLLNLRVRGAPVSAPASLVVGPESASLALPGITCLLLVGPTTAAWLPAATDAQGAADLGLRFATPVSLHYQFVALDAATGEPLATNGLEARAP